MRRLPCVLSALAIAAMMAGPAQANEIFGGLYVHDVKTPLNLSGIEGGYDIQVGWRGGRIGRTPLQPYLFGSAHTKGQTHFAAAGLSARFGSDRLFFRPGLGLAVHTGSAQRFQDPTNDQIDFGSRILFAPEVGVGTRIGPRTSLEASWVHLSQGQFFSRQNPGMDSIGVRLTVELP